MATVLCSWAVVGGDELAGSSNGGAGLATTAHLLVSSRFPVVASADIDLALGEELDNRARALLDLPEGQWFDRKSSRTDARGLARHLIGLANADGGVLVVGLHDGNVQDIGLLDSRRLGELQRSPIEHCQPPVRCEDYFLDIIDPATGSPAQLLVFDVPASADYHENTAGRTFRRVGDSTMELDSNLAQELRFDKGAQHFETTTVPRARIDDLDHDLLGNYARRVEHDAPLRLLGDRTGTRGQQLTVAAVLLFAKRPERLVPSASVRIVRHQGRQRQYGDAQRITADERIDAPIPRLIQQAQSAIARLQPTRKALGDLEFEEVPLVPQDVWLEGLVNAVVHRSYSLQGDQVHVDIFDDRIEITSPGTFPHSVDLADIENMPRFARNPRLIRVCSDLKLCQELGEGIRRMFRDMRDAGLADPLYRQTSLTVTLTLNAEPAHRAIDKQYRTEVATILSELRARDRLSTGELHEAVGSISKPVVRRLLNVLEGASLIEWHGNSPQDPRAYWTLPSG